MKPQPLATGKLNAQRTDCQTGTTKQTEIEYAIYIHEGYPDELVFQITKGGVTGCESFIIKQDGTPLDRMLRNGYCAQDGTFDPPIYDKLEVEATEMAKAWLTVQSCLAYQKSIKKIQANIEQLKAFNTSFQIDVVPIGCAGSNPDFAEISHIFEQFKMKYAAWLQRQKGVITS